ncbi:hypothetical protein HYH03_005262 [Edaphochlamys debaryana]|uniref:Uncharacterized protein n=1 Tax=Edaphochlamys debaryana TaxID=47281 RepID=A0A835Y840_9CHLO|nr:hypothetical protein HYH03_005262 [Edaphochlamys debaryana]|eukprot:KAG2496859.1 hypothetical protein HYH03_005262 [Edaphochlamys debaryana]
MGHNLMLSLLLLLAGGAAARRRLDDSGLPACEASPFRLGSVEAQGPGGYCFQLLVDSSSGCSNPRCCRDGASASRIVVPVKPACASTTRIQAVVAARGTLYEASADFVSNGASTTLVINDLKLDISNNGALICLMMMAPSGQLNGPGMCQSLEALCLSPAGRAPGVCSAVIVDDDDPVQEEEDTCCAITELAVPEPARRMVKSTDGSSAGLAWTMDSSALPAARSATVFDEEPLSGATTRGGEDDGAIPVIGEGSPLSCLTPPKLTVEGMKAALASKPFGEPDPNSFFGAILTMPLKQLGGQSMFEYFSPGNLLAPRLEEEEAGAAAGGETKTPEGGETKTPEGGESRRHLMGISAAIKALTANNVTLKEDKFNYTWGVAKLKDACSKTADAMLPDKPYLIGVLNKAILPKSLQEKVGKALGEFDPAVCAAFSPCTGFKVDGVPLGSLVMGFGGVETTPMQTAVGPITLVLDTISIGDQPKLPVNMVWRDFDFKDTESPKGMGTIEKTKEFDVGFRVKGSVEWGPKWKNAEMVLKGEANVGANLAEKFLVIAAETGGIQITVPDVIDKLNLDGVLKLSTNIVWEKRGEGSRLTATASAEASVEDVNNFIAQVIGSISGGKGGKNKDKIEKLKSIMKWNPVGDVKLTVSLGVLMEAGGVAIQLYVSGSMAPNEFWKSLGVPEVSGSFRIVISVDLQDPLAPRLGFFVKLNEDEKTYGIRLCGAATDCPDAGACVLGFCTNLPAFCTTDSQEGSDKTGSGDCESGYGQRFYRASLLSYSYCCKDCPSDQADGAGKLGTGSATQASKEDIQSCWKCNEVSVHQD